MGGFVQSNEKTQDVLQYVTNDPRILKRLNEKIQR